MASTAEAEIEALRKLVVQQGDLVRDMKSKGATKQELAKAVAELKLRKAALDEKEALLSPPEPVFNRTAFDKVMKRRFFWTPSFQIYNGVAGLYDYGPTGCAIKANLLSLWRSHFVFEEQMLEVDCSMLTIEPVLKASGHVARFTDLLVSDVQDSTQCFRADHLLEAHLEKLIAANQDPSLLPEYQKVLTELDNFSKEEIGGYMRKYGVRAPETGHELTDPVEFNLMFPTSIGPNSLIKGYLRPETAQGIFVNFRKLLDFNNNKLPFAAAQIGSSFRNEISPRAGLLRVREFTMAEIEHFVHPEKKDHPKFASVADLGVLLYSREDQLSGRNPSRVKLGDAIKNGTIDNQTLGYFIGRIYLFMTKIGIKDAKLRFRQHMPNEMAHYASDCWDAECKTSFGWVECIGCADRSAYDLSQHSEASGTTLNAQLTLDTPVIEEYIDVLPDASAFGKLFRKDAEGILKYLRDLQVNNPCQLEELSKKLEADKKINLSLILEFNDKGKIEKAVSGDGPGSKQFEIPANLLQLKPSKREVFVKDYTPNVIEPSFGIGRIIYSLLEHNFSTPDDGKPQKEKAPAAKGKAPADDDDKDCILSLPACIAPYKCVILPLSNNPDLVKLAKTAADAFNAMDVSYKVDDSSASIGRRYARTDEIGVPFGVTIDFDTVKNSSVTLRERDSKGQVRLSMTEAAETVKRLANNTLTWADVLAKFPKFEGQQQA
ncbi:glycyl-tRNA synthetase [Capsaspora owczarzaki ATCC 30864]|uniref:glycine--tRNA ligase n=1 Tax=Capsaspora owczarzaki (strain ATCC 30864) TaxID=595528 RepID=A0A0D2X1X8_CAPO3|nr:glycyl-tRNA synthetase [Capsaspora owczarzaki ATCC 30864]KJE91584.1 glycyl-tRNA synthetase [Capsaspora owczarzaki ATCC 30864]|eukprot:XP_004349457.1 glycyl-tRNA synthetase [Capsaspora owczarzaki ATCC 30864]